MPPLCLPPIHVRVHSHLSLDVIPWLPSFQVLVFLFFGSASGEMHMIRFSLQVIGSIHCTLLCLRLFCALGTLHGE